VTARQIMLFSGTSHPALTAAIAEYLEVPVARAEIFKFKNDNTFVKIHDSVRQQSVFVVQTSSPPVNDGLMELLLMIDALKRASARSVTVVMPYYAYCRSDKKDQPRISIAASLVAKLLESAGADRIITMDLHAEQIQGFFNIPVDQLLAQPVICSHIGDTQDLGDVVAVAPDAGSAKKTGAYARKLRVPLAIMDKRRTGNDDSAKILHLIGDVRGKTAVLFDDELSTGGSLVGAAHALHDNGAHRILAAVTHGILCADAPAILRSSPIEEVVITDSLPLREGQRFERLRVLSVAHIFGEAIRRINDGVSVTELFR
jgi:ribose-phosphate pyrophosphokinase